jgi:hypothetical protein
VFKRKEKEVKMTTEKQLYPVYKELDIEPAKGYYLLEPVKPEVQVLDLPASVRERPDAPCMRIVAAWEARPGETCPRWSAGDCVLVAHELGSVVNFNNPGIDRLVVAEAAIIGRMNERT